MGSQAILQDARGAVEDQLVLLLPDLTIDHYVHVEDLQGFEEELHRTGGRGGGTLRTREQSLRVGGDSARTAVALARLGVPVALVAPTDPMGRQLLGSEAGGLPADLRGVTVGSDAATTVALEFHGEDAADVDLTDPGPLEELTPEDLPPVTWELLEDATAVAVTSWNRCLRGGTAILERVVEAAGDAGTLTYLDAGDPTVRSHGATSLLDSPALEELDVWGLNGHEARFFAEAASGTTPEDGRDAARLLSREVRARVDVHTSAWNITARDGEATTRAGFEVAPQVRTGGGCAWNAGNLLGELLDLPPGERLVLAHATTAAFLEDPHATYPTLEAVGHVLAERTTGPTP